MPYCKHASEVASKTENFRDEISVSGTGEDLNHQERDAIVNALHELDWDLPKGEGGTPAITNGVVTETAIPAIEEAIKAASNFMRKYL